MIACCSYRAAPRLVIKWSPRSDLPYDAWSTGGVLHSYAERGCNPPCGPATPVQKVVEAFHLLQLSGCTPSDFVELRGVAPLTSSLARRIGYL